MNRPGVGVGVFIIKDGKFLMAKRKGAHGSGTWIVPGGWMEFGESFEQTAEREVAEEVDLRIKNIEFGAVTNNVFKEGVHSVTIWLTSQYAGGKEKILEPEKITELKWVDFNSLPRPLFMPWKDLLKSEFINGIKVAVKNT